MSDIEDEEIYEDEGPGEDLDLDEETVALEAELEDAAHLADDLEEEENLDEDQDEPKEGQEEAIPEKPLTEETAAECLSLLAPIGKGLSHAYVRLDVREKELTDISLLSRYIHLRYIDLSKNNLTDLRPLNSITNLLTVKADNNNLGSVSLDELPYLQVASFTRNRISSTSGLNHTMLEHLNLSFNLISTISDLKADKLKHLHTLELRGNKLQSTAGINLPRLRNLFMAGNIIKKLEGLENLVSLATLHMRDNQLESLDGLSQELHNLEYINIRGNAIASVDEFKKLKVLPKLRALVASENPATEDDEYKSSVIYALPELLRLDKDHILAEERQEANELMKVREAEKAAKVAEEAEQAVKENSEEMAPED